MAKFKTEANEASKFKAMILNNSNLKSTELKEFIRWAENSTTIFTKQFHKFQLMKKVKMEWLNKLFKLVIVSESD